MNAIRAILVAAVLAASAMAQTVLIVTSALPSGTVGVAYNVTVIAGGGTTPYIWSAANLPPGLVINGSSGIISGSPTAAGTFTPNIGVTDSRGLANFKTLAITIVAGVPKLSISTGSTLPNAQAGQSYSQTFTAAGGTPPYRWVAAQGFPTFWTLNATTGTFTGTPTIAGNFTFPIQVTDASQASATATFTVTVNPFALVITTVAPLFNGIIDTPYAQTFSASGGAPPYTWSLISGSAGGLTLDPATGILQGTPQNTGTFSFTVQVTDKLSTTVSQAYSITMNAPALTITVAGTLASGTVGVAYSQRLPLQASGGTSPYTWSIAGGSVSGLSFDPAAISLAGTPTTAGTFSLTVRATDSGGLTATKSIALTIAPAGLTITSVRQLPDTPFNARFSQGLTATGGIPPYTWSGNGLPAGLTVDANSGTISGVPVASGAFSFAITVTDSTLKQYSDRFSVNVTLPRTPPVSISGVSASIGPVQQVPLEIQLDSSFPVAITGQAFLSFAPDSGPADRTIQFSSGGSIASFSIPAGSTTAISDVPLSIQTGTVSGTLTISLRLQAGVTDITPIPTPTITAQLGRAAPVISDIQVNRTTSALSVVVTGYSTAREVTQMTFNFTAAAGQSLQTSASSITVPVDIIFANWYQDPVNGQYGSQFVFTQPFTVQGDPNQVTLASVVFTNRVGSTTVTVNK